MPGLDLPIKLRRLANGQVLSAEEITEMIRPFDADGDGALTQEELTTFLIKRRVGGPWFCQVLGKTLWEIAQDRWGTEVDSIDVQTIGRIISFSMARAGRPTKRYVLTPEAVRGIEPKKDIDGNPVPHGGGPLTAAPRKTTGGGAPPRAQQTPPRNSPRPQPGSRGPAPRRPSRGAPRPSRSAPRRPGPKPRR